MPGCWACVGRVLLSCSKRGLAPVLWTPGDGGVGPWPRRSVLAPRPLLLGHACLRLPQDPQLPELAGPPGPAGCGHDPAAEPDAAGPLRSRTVPGATAGPRPAARRGQGPLWQVRGKGLSRLDLPARALGEAGSSWEWTRLWIGPPSAPPLSGSLAELTWRVCSRGPLAVSRVGRTRPADKKPCVPGVP